MDIFDVKSWMNCYIYDNLWSSIWGIWFSGGLHARILRVCVPQNQHRDVPRIYTGTWPTKTGSSQCHQFWSPWDVGHQSASNSKNSFRYISVHFSWMFQQSIDYHWYYHWFTIRQWTMAVEILCIISVGIETARVWNSRETDSQRVFAFDPSSRWPSIFGG